MNPLISICIPTCNGATFIEEAMISAINQTYKNIEIIVSDDGSKDETLKIVNSFISNTRVPIKIYNHDANGIGANWNNTVKKASGEFIKFLFQDDVLAPTCVEKLVGTATQEEEIGLVYCKREILYDKTNEGHLLWLNKYESLHNHWEKLDVTINKVVSGRHYMWDYHLLDEPLNKIGEPTATLISKVCFDKLGFFNESLKQALDIEYWYRIMRHFKIGFVDEELVSFRLHDKQASNLNQNNNLDEVSVVISSVYRNYFSYLHPRLKLRKIVKAIRSRIIQIFVR
ncbi:glycosyltransferase family 2 protein [Winogradskyella alexanderae]|uniref:Glycosyltransferase n=1 Tax=Winogradskyella alexanderae TaxID=2877123 RepID=A0ABS7XT14_9FLAO|nr:glycosyltransferase [Winogradskyella alexanderae]MCA0131981.1 glycosyltransferase [Winogradskyella alexanderae]